MPRSFVYASVRDTQRTAIYVIRIKADNVDYIDIAEIAEKMRERIETRGDFSSDVVVVQGDSKETLRLHGTPHSVNRVRTAMFNAALSWTPIELD